MEEMRKFARPFKTDEMITIALEGDETRVNIQRAVLCTASPYFESALHHGFAETSDKKLRLPDCDEDVIQVFIYWLFKKNLPPFWEELERIHAEEGDDAKQNQGEERCILLIKVWVFGDRYLMPRLCNSAMSAIKHIGQKIETSCNVIRQAYALAHPNSKVRNFFADMARFAHFHGSLSVQDLEILVQTPGFFTDFMGPVTSFVQEKDQGKEIPGPLAWTHYTVPA